MSQAIVYGMLRVKNEARWIERVIKSIKPICDKVFVFDDHSTDGTPDICENLGARVHRSQFTGLDESRDKNLLLSWIYQEVPPQFSKANFASPYWALAIDGDEVLAEGHGEIIRDSITVGIKHVYALRVAYLWDNESTVRVDGVYANFRRPSLFRLFNDTFRYQKTPWGNGANFHCSNIPQELLHHSTPCDAVLLHYGYMLKEDRLKKFEFYNRVDPNNAGEDQYRHMVIGDVSELPATAKTKWAGPLSLLRIS